MLEKIKAARRSKVEKKFGTMKDIKSAVHKHEETLHSGKPLTKLKDGGVMSEKKTHDRLDKLKRGGKHGTKVNVIVAPQGGKQPVPVPVPVGAPVPNTPAGAMPPQAGGMTPGMKTGGKTDCYKDGGKMTAGAGSGEGRLEKIKNLPARLRSKKGI